ncbi:hypothetical protein BVG19_g119 [[Candida] boidinii]|nr:hypothetical protein BVG19_g119 [[Candida] boidinii]OWB49687.1 hypothetical protein B5S27_g1229 [[Candida] boidinii]
MASNRNYIPLHDLDPTAGSNTDEPSHKDIQHDYPDAPPSYDDVLRQSFSLDNDDFNLRDDNSNSNTNNYHTDSSEPQSNLDVASFIATLAGKSGMKGAFFNMANSILGAGVIGQAYAIKNTGVATGLIVLVILTFLIDWTIRLIIINSKLAGVTSYQNTVSKCFGTKGKIFISLVQGLFAYGGSMAFCVIIGDTIPHVLRSLFKEQIKDNEFLSFLLGRNTLIVLLIMGISYPLSLHRDISKLSKASGLALIGMLVIVGIVLFRSPFVPSEYKGTISASNWIISGGVFQGISVISFALVCHHNTSFIYNSMRDQSLDKFTKLTHIACAVSMIVCGIAGVSGYTYYGSKTKGNILNNFPSDDWVANIARFCFGLNMLTTFPLEIFVVREIIKDLILLYKANVDSTNNSDSSEELSPRYHFIITTVLCVSTMSVSLFTCNLGAILELVGATSACIMAYILPPLCFIKLTTERTKFEKYCAYGCAIFGATVMVISSSQTIYGMINGTSTDDHCVA